MSDGPAPRELRPRRGARVGAAPGGAADPSAQSVVGYSKPG